MDIQIDLTEQEIKVFSNEMNLVNQQQEQFNKLVQELQLNKEMLNCIWKSIYQRWQLDDIANRSNVKFPDKMEIKFENGSIYCYIADEIENT